MQEGSGMTVEERLVSDSSPGFLPSSSSFRLPFAQRRFMCQFDRTIRKAGMQEAEASTMTFEERLVFDSSPGFLPSLS